MFPAVSPSQQALLSLFAETGYARVETEILQPASLFLDLSGEDIRRRLFLTQTVAGDELCLRPEYTIPVCRVHLASGADEGDWCYLGRVFRQRAGEGGEFLQAGFESFGRADETAADAAALALALRAVRLFGDRPVEVNIGDLGLLEAVLGALDVPAFAQRRIVRSLSAGQAFDAGLPAASDERRSGHAGLLAAIEGQDPEAARAFVEDVISIAGVTTVGGRSAAEIADRFLFRAANRTGLLGDRAREVLSEYFALSGAAGEAMDAIATLAREQRLPIDEALARLRRRLTALGDAGIAIADCTFATGFVRTLEYYTGFIFEIRDPARAGRFVAAGGRYDRLLQHLGSSEPVPAIGCSFWLDRLDASA